jgi:glycosyltransferase involved in cell wall biosynthesis
MKSLTYIAFVRIPTEKAHGIQITSMCQAFSNQGYDVTLVVPKRKNTILQNVEDYYGMGGFKIVYLPTIDLVGRLGFFGFYLSYFVFCIQVLLRFLWWGSDIVYTRDLYTSCLLWLFGKKVYYEPHTKSVISGFLFRICSKSVHHFFPISLGLRDVLIKQGVDERSITVLPDAVDFKKFGRNIGITDARKTLDLPDDRFIVMYVGKYTTMGKKKGVDELVLAFAQIVREGCADMLLVIVGLSFTEIGVVKILCKKEGLSGNNFLLVPHVSHKIVPTYLWAANVLVMNYPNSEHYAKFMSPLKLFEYMASGTPVVSTDLPSVREVASEKDVVFIESGSIKSLKGGILWVKANPTKAKQIGLSATKKIKTFDWASRVRLILGAKNK